MAQARRRLIIDTDPGVDDAMAIQLALRSPRLELVGLTTIFGNVDTGLATENALRLLELAGRDDIPVARGAARPLASEFLGGVPFVHGQDGQGNTRMPPPRLRPGTQTAAEFIIEMVMRQPGEITLVPIGPLTNIALALDLEPAITRAVREVVVMGGNALCPGNATPAAEANMLNDPDAADRVFGADWSLTLVGLDVTHKVNMRRADLDELAAIDDPLARHVARCIPFYRDFFEATNGIDGIFVHDSTALAYVLEPSLFTTRRWPLRVDTGSGIGRGKTWPNPGDSDLASGPHLAPWRGRPQVDVCIDVEAERVLRLILAHSRGLDPPA